jgi:2-dehydropantoate 2-reductase
VVPSISSAVPSESEPQQPGDNLEYDFIVVTTKALPDLTSSLITQLRPLVAHKTTLVLIQNGVDIEVPWAAAFPATPVLSGVSMIGSRLTDPRTVFHEDPDALKLGAFVHHAADGGLLPKSRQVEAARLFVDVYNAGLSDATARQTGAGCVYVDDIVAARWRKLLWNGSFNTLCTLLRMSVGELLSSPTGPARLLEPAMREIAAVAAAAGYTLDEDVIQLMLHDTPPTSPFRPSMLVDLEKGRPIELEVILGAPMRIARQKGVPTPVLGQVHELLQVVQWSLTRPRR